VEGKDGEGPLIGLLRLAAGDPTEAFVAGAMSDLI
jgi:hypothetical protein